MTLPIGLKRVDNEPLTNDAKFTANVVRNSETSWMWDSISSADLFNYLKLGSYYNGQIFSLVADNDSYSALILNSTSESVNLVVTEKDLTTHELSIDLSSTEGEIVITSQMSVAQAIEKSSIEVLGIEDIDRMRELISSNKRFLFRDAVGEVHYVALAPVYELIADENTMTHCYMTYYDVDSVCSFKMDILTEHPELIKVASGATFSEVTPINKDQITLEVLKDAILTNGKVKEGLTFQEFIEALLIKINPEVSTKSVTLPTVTVNAKLIGTTDDIVVEVGEQSSSYSLVNSADKGTFTDGKVMSHKVTMGRTADGEIEPTPSAGCSDEGSSWDGDGGTSRRTVRVDMTPLVAGQEASEEHKDMTIGNITLTESYRASTVEDPDNKDSQGYPLIRSSYGNPLYEAAGRAISAGTCQATTTNGKTVNIDTKFYCWINGESYLGTKTLTDQSLAAGDVFIYPSNRTLTISWVSMGILNHPSSQMYTEVTRYLPLPAGGDSSKLLSTAPSDKPYKTYKVYTLNSNIPLDITNAEIKVS